MPSSWAPISIRRGRGKKRGADRAPFVAAREVERSAEALLHLGPVDHVPPGLHVVGPAVLVLEVVRVLPDIQAEDRGRLPVHDRVVLVRRADDRELAAVVDQPGPAGTEAGAAGRVELLLELLEVAEGLVDRLGELAARCAAALGRHDLPE